MKQKALSILILSLQCGLMANPTNPTVVNGDVSFDSSQPGVLNIQAGDRSIINWQDFSIDAGETTQFFQPDANSAVLNRVTGGNMSNIMGSLQANGAVYLINPSGVIFGPDAVVDTGAILASTLDLPDQLFLQQGDLLFFGDSEEMLVNMGTIQASNGDAILIGYQVENDGVLSAQNGVAAMAAGAEVLIRPLAQERVFIRVHAAEQQLDTALGNSGTIMAVQAELKADGNPFSMAINHSGSVTATGVQEMGGNVYLVSDNGNLDLTGTVTAQDGQGNGGVVNVYGQNIAMEATAEISVDGAVVGNGGMVDLIAGNNLIFYGSISAQGGDEAGDGGFVEISAPMLDFSGEVSTFAPNGETGTLLIDPNDIEVGTMMTTGTFNFNNNLDGEVWNGDEGVGSPPTSFLMTSDLIAHLGMNNVIIQSCPTINGGSGDITFLESFDDAGGLNSSHDLHVQATGDINVMVTLFNQGTGSFFFSSQGDINLGDGTQTVPVAVGSVGTFLNPAAVVFNAGGNVNLNGGTVPGAYAQLGVNEVNGVFPAAIYCDIEVTAGESVNLNAGPMTNLNTYAAIGHGGRGGAGLRTYVGDITFPLVEGDVNVNAGFDYAMIGHRAVSPGQVSITGNIFMPAVLGDVNVNGGSTEGFGLIGHGGYRIIAGSSLTGDMQIVSSNVALTPGSGMAKSFAGIGFTDGADLSSGNVTVRSNAVQLVTSQDVVVNSSTTASGSIGALFNNSMNDISIGLLSVNAQGNVVVSSLVSTNANTNAIIGTIGDATNFSAASVSNIEVVAQKNVTVISNAGPAYISNGDVNSPDHFTSVSAFENVNLDVEGTDSATIYSIGFLTVTSAQDINLQGGSFLSSIEDATIAAGNDLNVNSNNAPATIATVHNNSGNLTLSAGNDLNVNARSSIIKMTNITGSIFLSTQAGDINVEGDPLVVGGAILIQNFSSGNLYFFGGNDVNFNQCTINNPGSGGALGFGVFSIDAKNDINIGDSMNTTGTQVSQNGGRMILTANGDLNVTAGTSNAPSIVGPTDAVDTTVTILIPEILGSINLDASADGGYAKIGPNTPLNNPTGDIRVYNVAGGANLTAGIASSSFAMIGDQGSFVSCTVDVRGDVTFILPLGTSAFAQVGSRFSSSVTDAYPPFVSGTVTGTVPFVMCSSPYAVVADVMCASP